MAIAFHSGTHTGVHWYPAGQRSLLEVQEKDDKAKMEIWAWKVHEVALHEASQGRGPLTFSGIEPLLKKVSEEVTRKAQEKMIVARTRR